ncbi:FAD-dependent oxidoreductase, partial [Escherichia coli]|nr:FAD-dependent oxidoreductase [Escherichia coli]
AGYFLARAGHPVTLFEREANAGGVVKNIIPQFRIPAELIQHDIDFVAAHGVKFEYGCSPDLTIEQLKNQGFHYVLIATGTDKNSGVKLAGDNQNVWKSLPFLREYNKGTALKLGKHVVVVGAGNTAMDCARAALRVPGVEKATIVYRRSLQEMPAWREEYEEALHDGVEFRFLNNPERFDADGTLTLRVMSLGEPDEKGRRRPVETNETVTLLVDSLITAIGEQQDTEALNAMGVPLDKNGWPDVDHNGETRLTDVFMIGDVQRGPSSIVAAVGTARRATDAILSRENIRSHQNDKYWNNVNPAEIYQRKGDISITLVNSDDRDAFVAQEAARCLECNYVCSKCVDVCPNRANVSIAVPGFQNRFQTLHLDAYCNECGNCAQFCPWNGKPYKDKITVFSLAQDFDNSSNPGFLVEDCRVRVRLNNQSWVLNIDSKGQFNNVPPELNDMCRIISHVHQHHHYLLGRVEV